MAKPEWGVKRQCLACGARFYDMGRDPIACPKCETVFEPEAALKVRRVRPDTKVAKSKAVAVLAVDRDEEPDDLEDEDVPDDESDEEEEEDVGIEELDGDEADIIAKTDADADVDADIDVDEAVDEEEEDDTLLDADEDLDDEDLEDVVDADIDLDEEKER
ncbi:TIGR02300 family protein [Zavarzinia sp.]|uniref:TIGR02300 family protein n=1 Tax=Zavarzinia sp. TaxID=2027920 RepID=UPI00356B1175